jgi:hypothetical protein
MRPRIRASHPLRALEKELIAELERDNWYMPEGLRFALARLRRLARETPGMVDGTMMYSCGHRCKAYGLSAPLRLTTKCPKCAKEAS